MKNNFRILPIATAAAIMVAVASPTSWAFGNAEEFEEAQIYFELNDTDGDLGIHGKIDGGPWKHIRIIDSNYRTIMKVRAKGRLKRQGLTEIFFESSEPTFDELSPEEFFNRFPEGEYMILGWAHEGGLLFSRDEIRHVMPAPPAGITLNGMPDEVSGEKCDDEDPAFDPTEIIGPTATISWEPVTTSHPDLGEEGDITASLYQLVVELELDLDGEEFVSVYSVDVPPNVTSMTVPAEFLAQGEEFKYEILVKEEEGGNQTAVESCFVVQE